MEISRILFLIGFGLILPELEGMQKVKGIFTKPKIELRTTTDPKMSREIFKKFGVGLKTAIANKKHVCQPLNKKSNQIRGKPLCGCAVRLLQLHSQTQNSLTSDNIECVQTPLVSSLWNSVKGKKVHHPKPAQAVAKCLLTDGSHFYVVNSSIEGYYYIMKEQEGEPGNGIILGCFQDTDDGGDYKPVVVEVTQDPVEADDIFGVHGSLQEKGEKSSDKVRNILPSTACRHAMTKNQYIKDRFKDLVENQSIYRTLSIARRLLHPKSGDRIGTDPYKVLVCPATHIQTQEKHEFYLLRGSQHRLAYVLEEIETGFFFAAVIIIA